MGLSHWGADWSCTNSLDKTNLLSFVFSIIYFIILKVIWCKSSLVEAFVVCRKKVWICDSCPVEMGFMVKKGGNGWEELCLYYVLKWGLDQPSEPLGLWTTSNSRNLWHNMKVHVPQCVMWPAGLLTCCCSSCFRKNVPGTKVHLRLPSLLAPLTQTADSNRL